MTNEKYWGDAAKAGFRRKFIALNLRVFCPLLFIPYSMRENVFPIRKFWKVLWSLYIIKIS